MFLNIMLSEKSGSKIIYIQSNSSYIKKLWKKKTPTRIGVCVCVCVCVCVIALEDLDDFVVSFIFPYS